MAKPTRDQAAKVAAKVARHPGARAWELALLLGWEKDQTGRALTRARNLGLIRGGHGGWWPVNGPAG